MSDRIAVMQTGRVEQVGAPRAIYEQPASAFVASFVGATNLLRGTVKAPGEVLVGNTVFAARTASQPPGTPVVLSLRPEALRSLALFAREVMPHMRDLWTGFEDRWSPKPLPLSERAVPAPLNFERAAVNGTNGHATAAAASTEQGRGVAK